jgi:hypothetical protein
MAKKTTNNEMKIKNRKISDLIRAEYNPRELTKEQHNQLSDSLKRFGLVDPIIVNTHKDRKNILVGGHQRMKVWEELGNDTIPTVEVNLSLEKEKELNVRLNKNTGQFDMDILTNNFDTTELIEWGFTEDEIGEWGLNPDELTDGFSLPEGDKSPFQQMTFTLADEQATQLKNAISDVKGLEEYKFIETFANENSNGNALYLIIMQWAEQRK